MHTDMPTWLSRSTMETFQVRAPGV